MRSWQRLVLALVLLVMVVAIMAWGVDQQERAEVLAQQLAQCDSGLVAAWEAVDERDTDLRLARLRIGELEDQLASQPELPTVDPSWVQATRTHQAWTVASGDRLEAVILEARDSARGEVREILTWVQKQLYEHQEAQAQLFTAFSMQLRSLGVTPDG